VNWLNFLRKESTDIETAAQRLEIPLFPIGGVLFPGGVLTLKGFRAAISRHGRRLHEERNAVWHSALIASGKEVGETAVPHLIGTLA